MVLLLKRWVSGFLFVVAVVYVGLTCFLDLGCCTGLCFTCWNAGGGVLVVLCG